MYFNSINNARFASFFAVGHKTTDDVANWEFTSTKDDVDIGSFSIWLHPDNRLLEWRHPLNHLAWWCQEYFVTLTIALINPKTTIHDEGIAEILRPTFYIKYAYYSDWLKALDMTPNKQLWQSMFDSLPEVIRLIVG